MIDAIRIWFNSSLGDIPVKSWSRVKCDKCHKVGAIEKTCYEKNIVVFSIPACKFYPRSHAHYKCSTCNSVWLTSCSE